MWEDRLIQNGGWDAQLLGPHRRLAHGPPPWLRVNLKSISHRCHLILVSFVWELTQETINLPLGCLQGGEQGAGCRV